MAKYNTDALVSTDWLARHIGAPDVRIVDATFHLPQAGRDAHADYLAEHIPGAVFFDIDAIADDSVDLPHMLPPGDKFAAGVRRLGLGDGSRIVVYDRGRLFSAPRVWWTFRVYGHRDVVVLDGGLEKWKAEGRPLEEGEVRTEERHFTARFDHAMVRELEQMRANLEHRREQVVDARPRGRFEGRDEEVWPGRRQGHIPGSLSLPFSELTDPATGIMLAPERLEVLFDEAGVDPARPVVCTCGSGVTAATLAFGLHVIGARKVAVYDGSWAEWGLPGETPVETGPPAPGRG